MADWSALPLVSIAEQPAMAPQFYIPDVIQQIQEAQKIYQYAGKLERYGLRDRIGQTWSITVHDKIGTRGTTLSAGTKVPLANIISYTIYGTIDEIGNGVQMEKFLLNLSPTDIEGKMVRVALANDIVDDLDCRVRDAALGATTTFCYGGTYATVGVKAVTFGTYASGKITWSSIVRLDTQVNIQNIDKDMPLFIHPYQQEDLLLENTANTTTFTSVSQYTDFGVQKLFACEIGKVGHFRLIPTNKVTGTKESASTGTVQTADAFGFAPDTGVFFGWVLPPEIRYEPDYQTDFGRVSALAWYGQGGARLGVDRHNFRLHTTLGKTITASAL